jgi:hypothetical protein
VRSARYAKFRKGFSVKIYVNLLLSICMCYPIISQFPYRRSRGCVTKAVRGMCSRGVATALILGLKGFLLTLMSNI